MADRCALCGWTGSPHEPHNCTEPDVRSSFEVLSEDELQTVEEAWRESDLFLGFGIEEEQDG